MDCSEISINDLFDILTFDIYYGNPQSSNLSDTFMHCDKSFQKTFAITCPISPLGKNF